MKLVANPPNPHLSQHREWLGPPPAVKLQVYEEQARSILSENDSPDIPFRWSVNPYRGCQHACAYCYARPTHEYLGFGAGTDFDSRLTVKFNAPELLAREFARPGWRGERVCFSGVTDCYQPLEAVYQITRRCLQVCHDFRNPAGIVTKSYLVVRDAELLASLNRRALARVYISIPFADDAMARKVESGAPPPSRRFEALRQLAAAGVPVGVMVAPIIPGLNDRDIPRVLQRAAECGAEWAGYQALRLPGSVKDVFLTRLREHLPAAARRIEGRIRAMRGGGLSDSRFGCRMEGQGAYWESIRQLFDKSVQRWALNRTEPEPMRPDSRPDEPAGPRQLELFGR
jgi:DNA repair photolyase